MIRTYTQEDPIGLAGGLNLYGFAGGDPINFSDPFGLHCEPWPQCASGAVEPTLFDPIALLAGGFAGGMRALAGRLFTRGGARVAAADATATAGGAFASKAAARTAVAEMGLPEAQAAAVSRAIGRATSRTAIGIGRGEGDDVVVTLTRAGRDGKQVIESVVSSDGSKAVVQRAYDAAGRLVHVDPKP